MRILHIIFDETLVQLYKKKAPKKRERKKKQGARPKVQASKQTNSPKEMGHKAVREPLHNEGL